MDLTTATPADIDTRLVELEFKNAILTAKADRALRIANGSYAEDQRLQAAAEFTRLQEQGHPIRHEINEINAEWVRRGCIAAGIGCNEYFKSPAAYPGWSRVWVVPGGHAHRSTHCHSLYETTTKVLAPRDIRGRDLSGATEEEIVKAVGDRACTFCYPSAPVDKPSTVVLPDEDEKAKARAEREAKRQEREAAKAAKAIAHPDGQPLKDVIGWKVETEHAARQNYMDVMSDLTNATPEREEMYYDGWRREREALAKRLLEALAHKHGKGVEEMREELAPKVAKKAARDKREGEKTARRLGLLP